MFYYYIFHYLRFYPVPVLLSYIYNYFRGLFITYFFMIIEFDILFYVTIMLSLCCAICMFCITAVEQGNVDLRRYINVLLLLLL